jgi:hypothetical protein
MPNPNRNVTIVFIPFTSRELLSPFVRLQPQFLYSEARAKKCLLVPMIPSHTLSSHCDRLNVTRTSYAGTNQRSNPSRNRKFNLYSRMDFSRCTRNFLGKIVGKISCCDREAVGDLCGLSTSLSLAPNKSGDDIYV